MISGHGTIETAVQAIKNGAYDFIEKPFKTDRLLLILERALEAARGCAERRAAHPRRAGGRLNRPIGDGRRRCAKRSPKSRRPAARC